MSSIIIWIISVLAIGSVIIRPFKLPEYIWTVAGTALLLIATFVTPHQVLEAILKGSDVYLFLIGMMLLAETAREEDLFNFLAGQAIKMAKGSANKLFLLIFTMGVLVTAFLSNDATAVVLTPAVAAAVKAAKVEKPMPYLLICAFIANAASFILPISNPANLVIYGSHLPPLKTWLGMYGIPSLVCVVATYFLLYFLQKKSLPKKIKDNVTIEPLNVGGKVALIGIIITGITLTICSASDIALGLPTCLIGILSSLAVLISQKKNPIKIVKGISWGVLPLIAGLFVIVEAINTTGIISSLSHLLQNEMQESPTRAAWLSGLIPAYGCNLMNNLPAGLFTADVLNSGHIDPLIKSAGLIGIDVGPNLSVTGSLATILWLNALKREGQYCSAWYFLKIGAVMMSIALILTLLTLIAFN